MSEQGSARDFCWGFMGFLSSLRLRNRGFQSLIIVTPALSAILGFTWLSPASAKAVTPSLHSEDPVVSECQVCTPPEWDESVRVWHCSRVRCDQADPEVRCRIDVVAEGTSGAVETTDPKKKWITCSCLRSGEGPVAAPPPTPQPTTKG